MLVLIILLFFSFGISYIITKLAQKIEARDNLLIEKRKRDLAKKNEDMLYDKTIDDKILAVKNNIAALLHLYKQSLEHVGAKEILDIVIKQEKVLGFLFGTLDKYQGFKLISQWNILSKNANFQNDSLASIKSAKNTIAKIFVNQRSLYKFKPHLELDKSFANISMIIGELSKTEIINQTMKEMRKVSPLDEELFAIKTNSFLANTIEFYNDVESLNYEYDRFIAEVKLSNM